jgi:hypothetical protein
VVAYRSEFLHLWVVAATVGVAVDPQPIIEALHDLEREALNLPAGVIPPPGIALPVEVQHTLAGLQFLRDTLWEAHADFAGLLSHGGRVWAVRSGLEVTLEQLTGAPARWRWHEWEGGSLLAWTELGAAEVWGAEILHAGGALYAHYRPPLQTVPHVPATDADAFAAAAALAAALAQAKPQSSPPPSPPQLHLHADAHAPAHAPAHAGPGPLAPASSPALEGESRHARRRRRRREAAERAQVPEAAWRVVGPAPVAASPDIPSPDIASLEVAPPNTAPPDVAPAVVPPQLTVLRSPMPVEAAAELPQAPRVVPIRITTPRPAPAPARPAPRVHAAAPRPAVRAPRLPRLPRLPGLPGLERIPRGALISTLVAVILAGLIAAGIMARKPITALVVGRYTLDLATSPVGARVSVDGKAEAGRTPIALVLVPGPHRIDVNYGEYANASFDVDGSRGDHVHRDFAWAGSLGVASADSSVRLAVTLDGKALGHAPLWRDSIPVGRHRLGFSAPGVRSWEEEVQVKAGQSARVSAVPVKVPNYGLVTARAELVSSDGVEDLDGIPVFVDGTRVGVTPTDLKLTPGPHSIRIARAEGAPSIHLIDVQPGGRFFASAEFGRPADPMVAFDSPTKVSRAAPPTLTIRLDADLPLPVRQASLYLRPEGGSGVEPFGRLPVTWTSGAGRAQGTIVFPVDRLATAHALTYYVEIETREGEEYFSELHTIPVVP